MKTTHIIVMGVSGCGKSTLAHALATHFGWSMIEGDEHHPKTNIAKMATGIPLNDTDRKPWLTQLNLELKRHPQAVLSCSALKANYRDILRANLPNTLLVHAHASFETLLTRTQARYADGQHFMPASLLQSQFDTLELPTVQENCITVSCEAATSVQVAKILVCLSRVSLP